MLCTVRFRYMASDPSFLARTLLRLRAQETQSFFRSANYRVAENGSNGHRQIPNAATRDPVNFRF
jgi:hypothetical protein